MKIRQAAVAGRFYPDSRQQLNTTVQQLLSKRRLHVEEPLYCDMALDGIHAMIVPHAGYIFSGRIAGLAYRHLVQDVSRIRRIILIGPSHRVRFKGIAIPTSDVFSTPLGHCLVDKERCAWLENEFKALPLDCAHEKEHSLEVQLPFLQTCLKDCPVLPIVTGEIDSQTLAAHLSSLWDSSTLLIASSDLSHFHNYQDAQRIDQATDDKITHMVANLSPQEACGSTAINTVLRLAREKRLKLAKIHQINSGDTPLGDQSRVVGYASYLIGQ